MSLIHHSITVGRGAKGDPEESIVRKYCKKGEETLKTSCSTGSGRGISDLNGQKHSAKIGPFGTYQALAEAKFDRRLIELTLIPCII